MNHQSQSQKQMGRCGHLSEGSHYGARKSKGGTVMPDGPSEQIKHIVEDYKYIKEQFPKMSDVDAKFILDIALNNQK